MTTRVATFAPGTAATSGRFPGRLEWAIRLAVVAMSGTRDLVHGERQV